MKHNIIIYESSSFGGCYDYALQLHKAYSNHLNVNSCKLHLPRNASKTQKHVEYSLLNDGVKQGVIGKISFLWRHLVNPIIFLFQIKSKKPSTVIFNDFEQLSAFIWSPLFKWLAAQHQYGVFLHDPDRDDYPPSKSISNWSMKKMLNLMDFALYHEVLPDKEYYSTAKTKFISVPHGIYYLPPSDAVLDEHLRSILNPELQTILILGSIRDEKNYHLAIKSLSQLPNCQLLIAGKTANSRVEVAELKDLAIREGVSMKIIWLERYLSYAEMASCIQNSDLVWLNYGASFKSQSAIFSTVVGMHKKVLVAEGESAMAILVKKYRLGTLVKPDHLKSAIEGLKIAFKKNDNDIKSYLNYASWESHVTVVLEFLNSKSEPVLTASKNIENEVIC